MELTLIDFYRAIEDSSAKQLRLKAHDEPLAPEQRKEKARIMQRILRNDAQIRTLAEPWLAQFEHMFDGQPHAMH
jgi:flagellar protein FliT